MSRKSEGLTNEQDGWMGKVRHSNGRTTMTEVSMEIDGVEFPAIYPGISFRDIQILKNLKVGDDGKFLEDVPRFIVNKAWKAAKTRLKMGKSPFYEPGVDTSGATNIRKNNVLNMEPGDFLGESDETYDDGRDRPFVVYDSAEYSVRAAYYQLIKDMGVKKGNLFQIISKLAPPEDDNNVMAYTRAVYQELTKDKNASEELLMNHTLADSEIIELFKAMNYVENKKKDGSLEYVDAWNNLSDKLIEQYGSAENLGADVDVNPGRYPLINAADTNKALWDDQFFSKGINRYKESGLFNKLAGDNKEGVNYFREANTLINNQHGDTNILTNTGYKYIEDPRLGIAPTTGHEIALHTVARILYESNWVTMSAEDRAKFVPTVQAQFVQQKKLLEVQEDWLRLHESYGDGWKSVSKNKTADPDRWRNIRKYLTDSNEPGDYSSSSKNAKLNLIKSPVDSDERKKTDLQNEITKSGTLNMNDLLESNGNGRKVPKETQPKPKLNSSTVPEILANHQFITTDE